MRRGLPEGESQGLRGTSSREDVRKYVSGYLMLLQHDVHSTILKLRQLQGIAKRCEGLEHVRVALKKNVRVCAGGT
jgi:hypothetical protein